MARHRRSTTPNPRPSAVAPTLDDSAPPSGRHRRVDDPTTDPSHDNSAHVRAAAPTPVSACVPGWTTYPDAGPALSPPVRAVPRAAVETATAAGTGLPGSTAAAATLRRRGIHRHRPSAPPSGRFIAASVAVGAIFAAGATSTGHSGAGDTALEARADLAPPQILGSVPPRTPEPTSAAAQSPAELVTHLRTAERTAAEARRPRSVLPTTGTLTSSYGPRWGTNHNGLDIANRIGTPVLAVTDGEVLEAGPAAGFGLWVRIRQDDGTVGIYGHIDESLVVAGQRIQAGQQIATVGNRGQSTGPHLHYEVWLADGSKLDPTAWLRDRGVPLPGVTDVNS